MLAAADFRHTRRMDPAAAVQASEAAARLEVMQAEADRLQDLLERVSPPWETVGCTASAFGNMRGVA